MSKEIGNVETQFFTFASEAEPFRFALGGDTISEVTLAYETYGHLNEAKDNAILLFHAMTGHQHAAGLNTGTEGIGSFWSSDCHLGWWDEFIGSGRPLDTDRFFIICVNYLGGCYGSTGPSSTNPATGRPYGASFPTVMFSDIVDSQMRLLDHLGIRQLHAVVGASIGGMLCLSLATRYPQRVRTVISLASGLRVSSLQRILNFEQIYAIESDSHFHGGDYYGGEPPSRGMALARMIAHKTFVSVDALKHRANREISPEFQEDLSWYRLSSTLESYMLHNGRKFLKRFDANTYLRILDAWQRFDLLKDADVRSADTLFERCQHQNYLIFSISSDVCFYPQEQDDMVHVLREAGVRHTRITVHSDKGHDSFLVEPDLFAPHLTFKLNGKS